MAAKPEASLYGRLRDNLSNCHITRIESRVNLGIPDCLIAFPHGEFVMLELKVVKRGRKVALSPHQVAFHMKHADLRCPTFILVQYQPLGTLHTKKSELLLYRGGQAIDLVNLGVDAEPLARWPYGGLMWAALRTHLTDS